MDPKVNGQLQTEWGWLVAAYLFLGGVGAGAYTIAAINGFMGEGLAFSTTVGLWISFPALMIGSAFLLLDLGSPTRAFLAGMKPRTSWIARGTWIITIFMILSFIHLLLHRSGSGENSTAVTLVSVLGVVFAILTMAYTGILLGASKGVPFWRSGVVPVVFVVSAMVTGHFTVMLGVALFGDGSAAADPLRTMALEAAILVALEVLAIVFFLQAAFKLPDTRESAQRILRKRYFVVGYFFMGLGVPLVLMVYAAGMPSSAGTGGLSVIMLGALLGLIGGLILRQGILVCGTLPTWNIAGFKFRRIARPKDPKPAMGLLPPQ
ncbi:MAG: polysulfide reductase NrfD [Gemmatimonadota bacterium]|jgi:formate-dependent nitrite reductase membrane component NrfD